MTAFQNPRQTSGAPGTTTPAETTPEPAPAQPLIEAARSLRPIGDRVNARGIQDRRMTLLAQGGPRANGPQALPRSCAAGVDFFTPDGALAAANDEVPEAAMRSARIDLIKMLRAAFRPEFERLAAVSWVRVNPDDPARSAAAIEAEEYVGLDQIGLLVVGYTDVTPTLADRPVVLSRQVVATLSTMKLAGNEVRATVREVRDLTWAEGAQGCEQPFDLKAEKGLAAAAMGLAFNLVEELWANQFAADRTTARWYDGQSASVVGPVLAAPVTSAQTTPDGAPRYRAVLPLTTMGCPPTTDERYLSFAHLGPVAHVRGQSNPYFRSWPWAIVPGSVKYPGDGIVLGDVRYVDAD